MQIKQDWDIASSRQFGKIEETDNSKRWWRSGEMVFSCIKGGSALLESNMAAWIKMLNIHSCWVKNAFLGI